MKHKKTKNCCSFYKESLFDRIITRAARWTLMKSGANPKTAVSMYYRKARFYLDDNHFFTIQMLPIKYSRIKVLFCFIVAD